MRGVVEFGPVLEDEDDAGVLSHELARAEQMGRDDGGVGGGVGVGEMVESVEGGGILEHQGETAAGRGGDDGGGVDEPLGELGVAEPGAADVQLGPSLRLQVVRLHRAFLHVNPYPGHTFRLHLVPHLSNSIA